jgi:hypothetical protein
LHRPRSRAHARTDCPSLTSDADAVYCGSIGAILRVASDGTTSTLGTIVEGSGNPFITFNIAVDETYVYWVDSATAGAIMRAPKAGGGSATVLARDASPIAIAVDAHAVYWSDQAGFIKSVPK